MLCRANYYYLFGKTIINFMGLKLGIGITIKRASGAKMTIETIDKIKVGFRNRNCAHKQSVLLKIKEFKTAIKALL